MNKVFLALIKLTAAIICVGFATSAWAQDEEPFYRNISVPAEKYVITPGGVDIRTGRYAYDQVDLSVGDKHGLTFKRILSTAIGGHIDPFANFSHNWDITLTEKIIPAFSTTMSTRPSLQDPPQYELSVNFDGRSETFRGPIYASESGQVSKSLYSRLTSVGTRSSTSVIYTFQMSGGTTVIFRPLGSVGSGDCTGLNYVRCAYPSQVTYPDGTTYTFEYDTNSSALSRLRSVVSNRGYALLLEYSGSGASWTSVTKACVLNLTTVAKPGNNLCASNAVATTSYTYTTFNGREMLASATNAINETSSLAYAATTDGGYTMSFTKPGQGSPWQTVTIHPYINSDDTWDQIVYRQDFSDGSSYAYSYEWTTPGTGQRAGVAGGWFTDALQHTTQALFGFPVLPPPPPMPPPYVPRQVDDQIYQVTAGPVQVIDPLGRTTTSDYCDPNTLAAYGPDMCIVMPLQSVTNQEGDKTKVIYSNHLQGLIIRSERYAKPGSSLSPILESISDNPDCVNNIVVCAKPPTATDPNGNVTDYTYDPVHGGILTVTLPAPTSGANRPQKRYGYTQLYAWYKNSSGTLVQAPSPVWMLTSISECRTLASCTGTADETLTTISYGSPGVANNLLATSITVAAGDGSISATTTKGYDVQGNVLTVDGPLAGTADTSRTRYDSLRRVTGTITPDPDGGGPLLPRAVRNTYDPSGNLTRVEKGTVPSQSDSDWPSFVSYQQVDTFYDALGKKTKETVSAGGVTKAVTQYSYDLARRLECTAVRMDSKQWSSQTNACVPQITGPNGPDRVSKLIYNEAGEVVTKQVAVGTADQADDESYTYTPNGLAQTVTDGESNRTTFEYDGFDRLQKTRYPVAARGALASSTTDFEFLAYDPNGNVTQRQLRDGQIIISLYDYLNRIQTKDLPSPEIDVGYAYDLQNHVTGVTQGSSVVSRTYDALGRTRTEVTAQGTMTYDYDPASRRIKTTWPDGFYVNQDYYPTNDVSAIRENNATSGPGVLVNYGYDALGRRSSIARGNGTTTTLTYDSISRLQSLTQDLAGTANDVASRFGYNPASQLVSWSRDNNAYSWNGHYNSNKVYGANGLNQLSDGSSLNYDLRGNLTTQGSSSYSYTVENRLISGPSSAAYSYDSTGRLAQSSSSNYPTVRFQYDGTELVAEYNSSNQLQRRYVHGPGDDDPVVWYEGAGTGDRRWFHQDERGSIVAISDSTGAKLAINTYNEYGIPGSGNLGRFQYTGQTWLPEIGMYYYKARVYSPTLGRFLQTDPIGYKDGINWYAYVGNNPINATDPTGLKCQSDADTGSGSCTIDNFKDKNGKEITRAEATANKRDASKIQTLEAKMTSKYAKAKSLAAKNASVTIKGSSKLKIADQKVSGAAIVDSMEKTPVTAAAGPNPSDSRSLGSTTSTLWRNSSGSKMWITSETTIWNNGASGAENTFGHEMLHDAYTQMLGTAGGWNQPSVLQDQNLHQDSFDDAARQIR